MLDCSALSPLRPALAAPLRCGAVGLALALIAAPLAAGAKADGLVVEEVRDGFAAAEAGLRPGDVLLSWSRPAQPPEHPSPASGRFSSPFELFDAEIEQYRGPVTLSVQRAGQGLEIEMRPGLWRLSTAPNEADGVMALYQDGLRLLRAKDSEAAARRWTEAAAAV